MTTEELQLWNKIEEFELDDPDSSYTFSMRLAKENNWSLQFALRAITEYKKFIFLSCTANHPVTPSDQVDQVWHLHLIYTQSYWNILCKEILKKEIHHGPTKGGSSEQNKFIDYYEATKNSYEIFFKQQPPFDIWPNSDKRFSDINFRRINIKRNWIIKKP